MKSSEYAKLALQEQSYWWHLGKLDIINVYLSMATKKHSSKLKILNVGCGTGGTVPVLEKFGQVDNVDISAEAVKYMLGKGFERVFQTDATRLPFKSKNYDLIVAFDVLEHIKEDSRAIDEWKRVLKPKGKIILSVPAYPWLWSKHDEVMHHFRRYSRKDLSVLAKKHNFKTKKLSYAFMFTLLPLIVFRGFYKLSPLDRQNKKFSTKSKIPKSLNSILVKLISFEAKILRKFSLPAGSSLFVILNKQD